MAGKSWQPSHKPPCRRRREQALVTLIKKKWKEGGKGGGGANEKRSKLKTTLTLMPNANTKCYNALGLRAHGILVHAHI